MGSKMPRRSSSKRRLKKAQLSFYPEPEAYAALKALSARTGVPQQVYLRRGLDQVLRSADLDALRQSAAQLHRQAQQRLEEYSALSKGWKAAKRALASPRKPPRR